MELTCYRDLALQREARQLPATVYNLAYTLLAKSASGVVFVPIRTMQYLAILDAEEFVFLDSQNKSWIEIAWQNFQPQQRSALDQAVPYQAVYYNASAAIAMQRLQHDFALALHALAKKETPQGAARILKFDRSKAAST
jgi:hypothetical protein